MSPAAGVLSDASLFVVTVNSREGKMCQLRGLNEVLYK